MYDLNIFNKDSLYRIFSKFFLHHMQEDTCTFHLSHKYNFSLENEYLMAPFFIFSVFSIGIGPNVNFRKFSMTSLRKFHYFSFKPYAIEIGLKEHIIG